MEYDMGRYWWYTCGQSPEQTSCHGSPQGTGHKSLPVKIEIGGLVRLQASGHQILFVMELRRSYDPVDSGFGENIKNSC